MDRVRVSSDRVRLLGPDSGVEERGSSDQVRPLGSESGAEEGGSSDQVRLLGPDSEVEERGSSDQVRARVLAVGASRGCLDWFVKSKCLFFYTAKTEKQQFLAAIASVWDFNGRLEASFRGNWPPWRT